PSHPPPSHCSQSVRLSQSERTSKGGRDLKRRCVCVCMRGVIPVILLNHLDEVQVQPPRAKLPRPLVPIRALKIRARGFVPRRDVPAAAALIRHEGAPLPFLLALPFPISPTCLPAALCRIRAGASSSGSGGGGGG